MNTSRSAALREVVRQAGRLLQTRFGAVQTIRLKDHPSSIVTEADFASEKLIVDFIRQRYPGENLLGEESGLASQGSRFTWVIDPLDGTSNFAAGLPWFGVMVAVLEQNQPILAAMYLPMDEVLYFSERGGGVTRQGEPVHLSAATDLRETLVACGLDSSTDLDETRRATELMTRLVNRARNLRLTNCLLDFCYTLDGRLGACVNQHCRIWDIAPACLMFPEAGGAFTDLRGEPIVLDLDPARYLRKYAVAAGPAHLHRQVTALAAEAGF